MTSQYRENKACLNIKEGEWADWVVEAYECHRRVLYVEHVLVEVFYTFSSLHCYPRITTEERIVVLVPGAQNDFIDNSRLAVLKMNSSVGVYADNLWLLLCIWRQFELNRGCVVYEADGASDRRHLDESLTAGRHCPHNQDSFACELVVSAESVTVGDFTGEIVEAWDLWEVGF